MPSTFEHIATVSPDSTGFFMDFVNIPQTYNDLKIIWCPKLYQGQNANMYINNASTYSSVDFEGSSGTFQGSGYTTSSSGTIGSGTMTCNIAWGDSSNINHIAFCEIDVIDYASTKQKAWLYSLYEFNPSSTVHLRGTFTHFHTNPVVNISIRADSAGQLLSGTTASLYGIKRA